MYQTYVRTALVPGINAEVFENTTYYIPGQSSGYHGNKKIAGLCWTGSGYTDVVTDISLDEVGIITILRGINFWTGTGFQLITTGAIVPNPVKSRAKSPEDLPSINQYPSVDVALFLPNVFSLPVSSPVTRPLPSPPPQNKKNDYASSRGNPKQTALGGVAAGTLLATYRGHSVPFYAASMGANYAIGSLAFFGG